MTPDITRRNILKTVAVGLLFGPLVPSTSLAVDGNCATVNWAQLLEILFPDEPGIDDGLIGKAATVISKQLAAKNSGLERRLRQEISARIGPPVPNRECSPAQLKEIFAEIDRSPAFIEFWVIAVQSLCRAPELWKRVGYEGSSAEYGGYIDRGFEDIDWLPDQTEKES